MATPLSTDGICGCYYFSRASARFPHNRKYLPQVALTSHTKITPLYFKTTLTQTYNNPDEAIAELRYTFPLYDGVAVSGHTIRYADKILHGIVQQKAEAKKTYQAAVTRGETAGLLDSLPAGIFGVTLGNVSPNSNIIVEIAYIGELKHDAGIDGLRYTLPTAIAPRYGSYPGELLKTHVSGSGIRTTIDVDTPNSAIREVRSPSHPIAVKMGGDPTAAFDPFKASATLALVSAELDQDFVLQLLIDNIDSPKAILETNPTLPNQRALMATLVPKFNLKPASPEIVFIADQSGSMRGGKNDALVAALKVFIKSLPLGVRFNIIAFGNSYSCLFEKSQAYNETNVARALKFVKKFDAGYGGTELLPPIKAAFENRLGDLPLEVAVLTDGEIWGESQLVGYINRQIREKKVDARVFSLGIGRDVSHTLVEGMARAGRGFAQFVTEDEGVQTDPKIVKMLRAAMFPHTREYELEVCYGGQEQRVKMEEDEEEEFEMVEKVNECLTISDTGLAATGEAKEAHDSATFFDSNLDMDKTPEPAADRYAHLPDLEIPKLLQAPDEIPPLFPFNRTNVYVLLGPESMQRDVTAIKLRAIGPAGPIELTVPVTQAKEKGTTIHQLAAKKSAQDLEEGRGWLRSAKTTSGALIADVYPSRMDELVEREAVRLGEKFQVANKWCSFVAVEDNSGKSEVAAESREPAIRDGSASEEDAEDDDDAMGFGLFDSPPPSTFAPRAASNAPPLRQLASKAARKFAPTYQHARVFSPTLDQWEGPSEEEIMALSADMAAGAQSAPSAAPAPPQYVEACTGSGWSPSFGAAAPAPQPAMLPQPTSFTSTAWSSGGGGALFSTMRSAVGGAIQSFGSSSSSTGAPGKKKRSGGFQQSQFQFAAADAEDDDDDYTLNEAGGMSDTASGTSPMHALIDLQTFSGSWKWSPRLFQALELVPDLVSAGTIDARFKDVDRDVQATAFAIAFLETRCAGELKEVWRLVAEKAWSWLEGECERVREGRAEGAVMGVQEMVEVAKGVLGEL